jgi:hypothetical protein
LKLSDRRVRILELGTTAAAHSDFDLEARQAAPRGEPGMQASGAFTAAIDHMLDLRVSHALPDRQAEHLTVDRL